MFDDYTKAEFPIDIPWNNKNFFVRLYGAIGKNVIGASFFRASDGTESFSQALSWDSEGIFGDGRHDLMDLPPPPAKVAGKIAILKDRIRSAQGRLNDNPDAPQEWRSIDENAIEAATRQLARLEGKGQ